MYVYTCRSAKPRSYGFSNLVGDAFLTIATGGLWFLWVVVREIRR